MTDPASLKHDKPFNRAAIVGYVLAVVATVAVGSVILPDIGWVDRRGTASYWLSMLPAVVWVVALSSFSRWAVALLPVVLGGTPLLLAGLALTRPADGGNEALTFWAGAAVAALLGGLGLWWLRTSASNRRQRR